MSTFYVLPPRTLLGDHFADYLAGWLPGLDWDAETRVNLAEAIAAAATCQPYVHVVFRDDLPEGVPTLEALQDGFGAEEGDEVIEVRAFHAGELRSRRWPIRRAA